MQGQQFRNDAPREKILVLTPSIDPAILLRSFLHGTAFDVLHADEESNCLIILKEKKPSFIFYDLRFSREIEKLKKVAPQCSMIAISVDSPLPESKEDFLKFIEQSTKNAQKTIFLNRPMIAQSPGMKEVLRCVQKVAGTSASVMITGESGTGKEEIAHAIHYLSSRRDQPFVKVNCAAVPDTLIESEFFGHERGAFTGALAMKKGIFELSNGGSLLLDEISEVPLALQAKLLRVTQEMEFQRLGSTKNIKVDVRLIATSNRNLLQSVKNGEFREDLYYRLNVFPIAIPPLRERTEDIIPLANLFLSKVSTKEGGAGHDLSVCAQEKLLAYPWPGNVRELGNIIERAAILSNQTTIFADDLSITLPPKKSPICPHSLAEVEKLHILRTLANHGQNRTKTAIALGISLRTLRNKLALYRLE